MQGGNLRVVNLPSGTTEFTEIEKRFKESAGKCKDASGQQQDWTINKVMFFFVFLFNRQCFTRVLGETAL